MKNSSWLVISCGVAALAVACSSSGGGTGGSQSTSSGSGGHKTTTSSSGTMSSSTGATGGSGTGGGTTDGGCSSGTPVSLTVKNYLSWCSVKVAGGTASSAGSQTVCVAAGAVKVDAVANTGFALGTNPWHDVDGDTAMMGVQGTITGSGQSAQSEATVTVTTGSKCVWACCETATDGGASDCPTMDQCP